MLKIGSNEALLWVVEEPIHKQILGDYLLIYTNTMAAEAHLSSLTRISDKHAIYE
ncbi:MAG: hypothetical protein WAL66_13270 [Nitrososphaeraceae archaeon]|jgi:hypothetical protein